MGIWKSVKDQVVLNRLIDEKLHELAVQEIQAGKRREGLWAKAIVEAGPDERLAKVAYLRLLVQRLKDEAYFQERTEAPEHESSRNSSVRASQAAQQAAEEEKAAAARLAIRKKVLLACEAIKKEDLEFRDYELLARAVGATIRYQGFIVGAYYYEKLGTTTKIKKYKELRPWFLKNVVDELETTIR